MLGIDIGGTFTDLVLLRDGRLIVHKLLSTPDDPARALLEGAAHVGAPAMVVHGTTVATNALLERRGAPIAFVTTVGFGDLLAIGRGDRPSLYDLDVTRPAPLAPWVFEVDERVLHDGTVLRALEPAEIARLTEWLAGLPVEAVAVCLLHAYANPAHEQLIASAISDCFVSASHRILAEPREYERASTTAVNAYVAPALGRYLGRVETALAAQGVRSLRIMASDGGSMGLATARELPARATLSGPAGGVVGARAVALRAGFERIISFDMGGTSTDVALCDRTLPRGTESRVGGLPVRLPSLDIHTVGAGGGSLARVDAGGALRVGPQSAGANPGPACYGRGTQPTVTDANLLLGRLQAQAFLGGRMALDLGRAEQALAGLGEVLATPTLRAALGVVRVANAAMERAIRAISVERGDDPRDFVLVAFGGAGPLHAAHLAEALGMRRVLVPRYPGVLSALGMLAADVTRATSRALLTPLDTLDDVTLGVLSAELAAEGLAALAADGEPPAGCRIDAELDLRYAGQSHELATPLPEAGPARLATLTERFHTLHERRYGHAMRERVVEAVVLRVTATSVRPPLDLLAAELPPRTAPLAPRATVMAALTAEDAALAPAALYERDDTRPGDTLSGPAVVTQLDATTVIPPGWRAAVDHDLNLLLELE